MKFSTRLFLTAAVSIATAVSAVPAIAQVSTGNADQTYTGNHPRLDNTGGVGNGIDFQQNPKISVPVNNRNDNRSQAASTGNHTNVYSELQAALEANQNLSADQRQAVFSALTNENITNLGDFLNELNLHLQVEGSEAYAANGNQTTAVTQGSNALTNNVEAPDLSKLALPLALQALFTGQPLPSAPPAGYSFNPDGTLAFAQTSVLSTQIGPFGFQRDGRIPSEFAPVANEVGQSALHRAAARLGNANPVIAQAATYCLDAQFLAVGGTETGTVDLASPEFHACLDATRAFNSVDEAWANIGQASPEQVVEQALTQVRNEMRFLPTTGEVEGQLATLYRYERFNELSALRTRFNEATVTVDTVVRMELYRDILSDVFSLRETVAPVLGEG